MNDFAGTATLVRLALRRDRVILPLWIVVFVTMAAGSASASIELYPDVQDRVSAGWVLFGAFLLLGQFGPIFDLPQGLMDVSPYAHTPRLPGGDFSATPVIWLTAIAFALALTGFATFRRRDIG